MLIFKIEGLEELTKELQEFPKAIQRATRSAIDTTATAVKNLGIDESYRVYNVEMARLLKDSRGRVTSVVKRTTQTNPTAIVTFKGGDNPKAGDRPGLQHFATNKPPSKRTSGWKPIYAITRGGTPKTVKRGFFGEGKLKGQGIFQRQEGTKKIVRQTGSSLKQMVMSSAVYPRIEKEGMSILAQKLIEAVDKQLKKMGRK